MVDNLFLHGELFVLRCSFKNLPILGPILIGSLFYVVFYTRDRLDFSFANGLIEGLRIEFEPNRILQHTKRH